MLYEILKCDHSDELSYWVVLSIPVLLFAMLYKVVVGCNV